LKRPEKDIPLVYHSSYESYDFGETHPFRGDRFGRFITDLKFKYPDIYSRFEIIEPVPAKEEDILMVHNGSYYSKLLRLEKTGGYLTLDTSVQPGSMEAARMICGGSIAAVRLASERGLALGFGGLHHAGPDYGGGFCLLNGVAVSAAYLKRMGFGKILILDTDAHQGNGTMDIFYEDPSVLFISLHQDPRTLFPGVGFTGQIGSGDGEGFTVNIPLPPLSGIDIYRQVLREIVFPLAERFDPEMIIRNGGSDPLQTDDLTNLGLDPAGLTELTGSISEFSLKEGIPITELFLSGYGKYVTEGWFTILSGILNEPIEIDIAETWPSPSGDRKRFNLDMVSETISDLKSRLEPYWGSF